MEVQEQSKPKRAKRPGEGHKPGVVLDDRWRERIKQAQLTDLLIKQAKGETSLEPLQVKSIEILLRKVLPDLQTIDGDILSALAGQDNLDPVELSRQIGSSLATNPAILIDILRNDPQARSSVFQAIDQLKRELTPALPAIELPEHATQQ
ncbi:MAG: hypothetical protein ACYDBV_14885 [Nitrospiria bacterium]